MAKLSAAAGIGTDGVSFVFERADVLGQKYPCVLASYAFDDPSPAAFNGALATFTLAALYLHTLHREDQYQDYCLFAAIVAAAVTWITRYILLFDEPLAQSIQIYLPMSIVVGSVVSAILHRIHFIGSWTRLRGKEEEREQRREVLTGGQEKGEDEGS